MEELNKKIIIDAGHGGIDGGVIGVAFGLDDLQIEQVDAVPAQDQGENTQQHPGTEFTYSFHVSPPI